MPVNEGCMMKLGKVDIPNLLCSLIEFYMSGSE